MGKISADMMMILLLLPCLNAKVVINSLFSDHMVLQTNYEGGFRPFLHGYAESDDIVRLVGAPSRTAGSMAFFASAGKDGRWKMQLDPHMTTSNDDRFNLTITGSADGHATEVTANDVVFGEVFICAGESSMALTLEYDANATAVIAEADSLPNFRLFGVPENPQSGQIDSIRASGGGRVGHWQVNSAKAVANFSAVCYLGALQLWRMRGDRPETHFVGLVWSAFSGTCIESWMDPPSLQKCGINGSSLPIPEQRHTDVPINSSELFNGMIAPLVTYSFRAMWWGGGECNTYFLPPDRVQEQYRCLQTSMVESWRTLWGAGDQAFIVVQLAPNVGDAAGVSRVRLAQEDMLPRAGNNITTIGMAVAYDIGSPCDLRQNSSSYCTKSHLQSELGRRIALSTLRVALSWMDNSVSDTIHENIHDSHANCSGPMSPRVVMAGATAAYDASADGEGTIREDSILVTFERFSAGGLTMRGTAFCAGQSHVQGKCCEQSAFNMFRLHDISTGQYRDTTAQIQGDGLTVVLNILPSSERHASPSSEQHGANDAVHLQLEFNIDSVPQCALYNSAGLPAPPFIINIQSNESAIQNDGDGHGRSSQPTAATASLISTGATALDASHKPSRTPSRKPSRKATAFNSPPRGINTWNFFHSSVDELVIKSQADALVSTGTAWTSLVRSAVE
jgi:hypothetical protein